MSEETEIFNLMDLSDLKKETTDELKGIYVNRKDQLILSLFEIKNILSIDEIIVALSRKYKVNVNRGWIVNRLYALKNKKLIFKVKGTKGIYEVRKKKGR